MHVSAACVNCKKAHLACDVSRPCNRCVATDKADTCRDIQHKKRGRPKMMRDANNNKIRPTNNNSTSTATGTSKNNKLMLSTSSDVMTVSSHDVMTILLSMDLCCARVSDKSLEYLELYPQEFSHRSLYDFLIPGESQQTLSRLHRCLLDNAAQHQKSKQPTNYIRSSFEKFFSFSLEPLLNIANGSLTLKQTLKFRYGRDSSKTEEMNCRFYLGGGFGADLFDSHGLDQLYIVYHLTSNIPHNMNDMIHLPPLIINNNDSMLEETEPTKETLEEAENSNNSNKMSSPVMMKRTVSNNNNNTIHLPLISSSPNYENTKNKSLLDRFRYNTQSQSQQFIHPNELYYLKTTSSRLSSEAIARTAYPYLSKASSNTTGKGKKLAAYRAVDEYINADQKVVGIGSGSTVVYVVERILQRPELKHIVYIPTSFQSKILILEGGLQLGSIEQHPEIDVTIDGADEVDEDLNAIKGGGACQFQEKVIAEAAKKFVIVADFRKKSKKLGTGWTKGVPIEVVPMTYRSLMKTIETKLSVKPISAKLRMAVNKAGPVVTDNGNFVIDAHFGTIKNPQELLKELKLLTGVYEVGLFCNMAEKAYFGEENGSVDIWFK
ncbi:ribose 5-phosphate isomerase A-domain-containing protein [Gilbertella persicaria]|uniref:ribose 5-phosphate isomerase A-domain-containing protein n=1 Tax=Gilbertella persicaria TaxID=101096 RepID=UPI00222111E2|nr:ribose 5-phosphate isomerase A-domain-containing protein [Gilbertella persicaria]KAI8098014.1 ribose 5-phosphate isomerase A-domain-containing protein [Gilbertella persicaria]